MRGKLWPIAAATAALLAAAPTRADEPARRPARIVSLNLCTDELLLRLAAPDRIASVTWLSRDPRNGDVAELAGAVGVNHGLAEEIFAARPDLVVAGRYTTRTTVALLKRVGLRVVEFGVPTDIAAVRSQILDFAALVGEPGRGEAMVAALDGRLAGLGPPPPGRAPGAFVLSPNGFAAGRGSLVDDVLTRAGLDNLAARLDLGSYSQVPLERVVLERTDVLVVDTGRGGPPSLATAVLDHPVLAKLRRRLLAAAIPARLWTCAGPGVAEAVERLRAVVLAVQAGRP